MSKGRKLLTVLMSGLLLGLLGISAGAGDDPCRQVDDLILCEGGEEESDPDHAVDPTHDPGDPEATILDSHPPTPEWGREGQDEEADVGQVSPATHQDPHEETSEYLGDDTCRYWGTRYADGDYAGDANYGADDSMGAYGRANANEPWLPGTNYSGAYARVGVQMRLSEDWPQPASIEVTYPWNTQGRLDVNADYNASAEASHETNLFLFRGDELAARSNEVSRSINTGYGPRTHDVDESGDQSLTVSSPGGMTYTALASNLVEAEAEGSTATFDHSRGVSQFFAEEWHVWLEHQDWYYDLPDGYMITSC